MNPKISSLKYWFPPESIEFVTSSIRKVLEEGDFLTAGKYCSEFEKRFASYAGAKYAVAMSSGTAALETVFQALDVRGHEVIVPTNTFAATAASVIRAGGKPIFADCGNDLCVDPDDALSKVTEKTKAIVTVHVGGLVSPGTELLKEFCESRGIYLVEDAAHAHGSRLNGRSAGTFGVAGAFSFFATKVMTTGEGGMAITNLEEIEQKMRLFSDQGKTPKGIYQNYHTVMGNNCRMTEFQAIMGISQLNILEESIRKRTEVARLYDSTLRTSSHLSLLEVPKEVLSNYYKYVVFPKTSDRESLYRKLKQDYGISLSGFVYEIPCHLQPIFKEYSTSSLPKAEDLCSKHICLPIYPSLPREETIYVADSLLRCLE